MYDIFIYVNRTKGCHAFTRGGCRRNAACMTNQHRSFVILHLQLYPITVCRYPVRNGAPHATSRVTAGDCSAFKLFKAAFLPASHAVSIEAKLFESQMTGYRYTCEDVHADEAEH